MPCKWVKSHCILQLANLTAYLVFQDCTKFSWIFGLKKSSCAVSIKPNQGNCQNLCRAGALTADPNKANSVGVLSQCQGDLWKVLSNPVCHAGKSVCARMCAEMLKTWGAQTICFASWDFPSMASSAFHVLCIKCNQPHSTIWWSKCIGSLKCIKCHLLHRFNSVPSQTYNNCLYPLLLLPFSFYCRAGNGIHFLTRQSNWV